MKSNFCLTGLIIMLLNLFGCTCFSQSFPNANTSSFIGAEFTANISQPGKLKIRLQIFYDITTTAVPDAETINVISNGGSPIEKSVTLKKESEFLDVKYPQLEGKTEAPPAVKCVLYSTNLDLSSSKSPVDLTWKYTGATGLLANVDLNNDDKIALLVHIAEPKTTVYNHIPTLGHLPFVKVNSDAVTTGNIIITDDDKTNILDLAFTTPMIYRTVEKSIGLKTQAAKKTGTFKKINYRDGYSSDVPGGKSFSFDSKQGVLKLNKPPFGNYLYNLTITDKRNEQILSQHQAVFIISSIL